MIAILVRAARLSETAHFGVLQHHFFTDGLRKRNRTLVNSLRIQVLPWVRHHTRTIAFVEVFVVGVVVAFLTVWASSNAQLTRTVGKCAATTTRTANLTERTQQSFLVGV